MVHRCCGGRDAIGVFSRTDPDLVSSPISRWRQTSQSQMARTFQPRIAYAPPTDPLLAAANSAAPLILL